MIRPAGNKKGSLFVFIAMITVSVIMAISVVIEGAAVKAIKSYGYAVADLACQSIISEFITELKEDYGLLGFTTGKANGEKKIQMYMNHAFNVSRGRLDPLQMELHGISANLSGYSMVEPDNLEEQIIEYMKLRVPEYILSNVINFINNSSTIVTRPPQKGAHDVGGEKRMLRNQNIINSLPSRIHGIGNTIMPEIENLPELSSLMSKGKENLYINLYILKKFRHLYDSDDEWKSTFFSGEIEYILSGRFDDDSNKKSVRTSLIILRSGINLSHIYTNQTKLQAIIEAAAILTPGPEAAITQAAIAVAWAAAEAGNDMARLEKGGKVPLYKTESDWMIDLDSILENLIHNSTLEPDNTDGMEYDDYLMLLLLFQDKNTKLIRIMDLIQLNIKGRHHEGFSISEVFTGIDATATIRRKKSLIGFSDFHKVIINVSGTYFSKDNINGKE